MESFNNYIKSLESRINTLENRNYEEEVIIEPSPSPEEVGFSHLGYYPYWRKDVDISKFSHITKCFLSLNENGSINWSNIDNMKVEHPYQGVSIGGWTDSPNVKRILNNHKDKVINQLVLDCNKRGLKYINYDIEYPESNLWIQGILNTTKEQIKKNGFDIKLCVAAGCWEGHLRLLKGCNKYLDWLEIMVYDVELNEIIPYTKSAHKIANEMGYQNKNIFIGISFDKKGDNMDTLLYKEDYIKTFGLKGTKQWEVSLSLDNQLNKDDHEHEEDHDQPGGELEGELWESNKARDVNPFNNKQQFRGRGSIKYNSNGEFSLSGPQPRIYVDGDIQDVEVSIDYMRVGTSGKGWSGGTIGVRSHTDGHSREPDKAHTYYFRLKHEGKVDLVKERIHGGGGQGNITLLSKKYKWNSNEWYNVKFKCYNIEANLVKLEGYINNKKVIEFIDNDKIMYRARGVVFIRNTDIKEAKYKNLSINNI